MTSHMETPLFLVTSQIDMILVNLRNMIFHIDIGTSSGVWLPYLIYLICLASPVNLNFENPRLIDV